MTETQSSSTQPRHITILGGGVAGLAAGFYAKKDGYPLSVFETEDYVGGFCRTLDWGDFRFDTGAHRFHDRYANITHDIIELLGTDVHQVHAPSQMYHDGKFIDFPLSPINAAFNLGIRSLFKTGLEVIAGKMKPAKQDESFEDFAVRRYGRSLAERLLLNYSRKLWGVSSRELSSEIAGERMKGLTLGTLIREVFEGKKGKTQHLDGSFLYPTCGIGEIPDRLAAFCGHENIHTENPITTVYHDGERIKAIQVGEDKQREVNLVVSSIPLDVLVQMMQPSPPPDVLSAAQSLEYRSLILAALFLDKPKVSDNASVYFPDSGFPFTRVSEPRNRSEKMSPAGKTSLVAEVPCQRGDDVWNASDSTLLQMMQAGFEDIGWIEKKEIVGMTVERIPRAYPVLRQETGASVQKIRSYLSLFPNLKLTGRNGLFRYVHIHDLMKSSQDIVSGLSHAR